jgi:hypothetical protein
MTSAPVVESRRPSPGRLVGFLVLLSAVTWGLGVFSAYPLALSASQGAQLTIAFKHVAAFEREGRELSREEIEKLPRHMRPQNPERSRTGRRVETLFRLDLDGRRFFEKTYRPSGLRGNGPTFAYEELLVPTGRHLVEATLIDARSEGREEENEEGREGNGEGRRQWRLRQQVEIRPRQLLLVEFSEEAGLTLR